MLPVPGPQGEALLSLSTILLPLLVVFSYEDRSITASACLSPSGHQLSPIYWGYHQTAGATMDLVASVYPQTSHLTIHTLDVDQKPLCHSSPPFSNLN